MIQRAGFEKDRALCYTNDIAALYCALLALITNAVDLKRCCRSSPPNNAVLVSTALATFKTITLSSTVPDWRASG